MQVTAKLNYLRIAPRKVRLVADMIRGKKVEEARTLLRFSFKKSTRPLEKLLNSAVANAKNDFALEEKDLKIVKLTVDEGPKLKRWRPRSRGRAMEIQKKTSHITIVLEAEKETRSKQQATPAVPQAMSHSTAGKKTKKTASAKNPAKKRQERKEKD